MKQLKVALVHDWLTGMRGGERCLEIFLQIYPQADIYTLIHIDKTTSSLIDSKVKGTSFLQKIPFIKYFYRWLLPIFPLAFNSIKLEDDYDLVISLNHAGAKNIKIPKNAKHICYCFTPMRYIWDQTENYFGKLRFLIWPIIKLLRAWDVRGSQNVDLFVTISSFVSARVRCFYKRNAKVIYPAINDFWFQENPNMARGGFFLYAGALVPYKNVEKIIEAFNETNDELYIVGDGPLKQKLQNIVKPNIRFIGRVTDAKLLRYYNTARALVFAAKEDFGLIPIEAQATGTPVIAGYGGALKESLTALKYWRNDQDLDNNSTGVFFPLKTKNLKDEIISALSYYKDNEYKFSKLECVQNARRFSLAIFKEKWREVEEMVLGIDAHDKAQEISRKTINSF